METYEQRQLKIEEDMMNDWIGLPVDMRDKSRKEVLTYARKYLGNPVKQPAVTTDMDNPEGVPDFVQELERDVYEPGETKIIKL